MNLVDVFLLLVIFVTLWAGWSKGFIIGIIDLLIWIGSLLMGFFLYRPAGGLLQQVLPSLGAWTLPVAFIIISIFTKILLSFLFNHFLRTTPPTAHRSFLNRALGLVPGFVNGVVYATILAALLLALPVSDTVSATTRDSKIAGKLAMQVEWVDALFSPIFGEAARQTMNQMTVEPESNETVKLRFTVKDPITREDLEAAMLELVNEERVKRGLTALKPDPELTEVARAHSRDMFARGYFSHYTPEHKDPFDRMKAAGVSFIAAGENLALGQTLNICHRGLMNSPGHKANILNKSFGRLGIGILDGGIYGLMISQEFRN
jgi:uncharacterized protein YkwD